MRLSKVWLSEVYRLVTTYDILSKAGYKNDSNETNRALIGEPPGQVDRSNKEQYETFKNEVWNNIQKFGDNTNYNHNFDVLKNILIVTSLLCSIHERQNNALP